MAFQLRNFGLFLLLITLSSCGFQLRGLTALPENLQTLELVESGLSRDQKDLLVTQFKRAGAEIKESGSNAVPQLRVVFESSAIRRLVNSASSDQITFRVSKQINYSLRYVDKDKTPAAGQLRDSVDIEVDENDIDGRNNLRLEAEKQLDRDLISQLVSRIRRL